METPDGDALHAQRQQCVHTLNLYTPTSVCQLSPTVHSVTNCWKSHFSEGDFLCYWKHFLFKQNAFREEEGIKGGSPVQKHEDASCNLELSKFHLLDQNHAVSTKFHYPLLKLWQFPFSRSNKQTFSNTSMME